MEMGRLGRRLGVWGDQELSFEKIQAGKSGHLVRVNTEFRAKLWAEETNWGVFSVDMVFEAMGMEETSS